MCMLLALYFLLIRFSVYVSEISSALLGGQSTSCYQNFYVSFPLNVFSFAFTVLHLHFLSTSSRFIKCSLFFLDACFYYYTLSYSFFDLLFFKTCCFIANKRINAYCVVFVFYVGELGKSDKRYKRHFLCLCVCLLHAFCIPYCLLCCSLIPFSALIC